MSVISWIPTQKQWAKKTRHKLSFFFFLKTVYVIYLWLLVVARWLLIRDVQSHMGLCCCLWCPTKSASASVVTPTRTERALRGLPPCQGETSHLNKDSFVLNNIYIYIRWDCSVGLERAAVHTIHVRGWCWWWWGEGMFCNQKRSDKAYGEKQNVNKKRWKLWNSYNTTLC